MRGQTTSKHGERGRQQNLDAKAFRVVVEGSPGFCYVVAITPDGKHAAVNPMITGTSSGTGTRANYLSGTGNFFNSLFIHARIGMVDRGALKHTWAFDTDKYNIRGGSDTLNSPYSSTLYGSAVKAMLIANDLIRAKKPDFSGLADVEDLKRFNPEP
jgi:hypothetical protein